MHTRPDLLIRALSPLLDGIADPQSRATLQAKLLELAGRPEWETMCKDVSTVLSDTRSHDLWTSRARPTFLYVMYVMILWALPMGVIAAVAPATAHAISTGMTTYLEALPEPLYTFFGTGYLGYATLRQWGKVKGSDR